MTRLANPRPGKQVKWRGRVRPRVRNRISGGCRRVPNSRGRGRSWFHPRTVSRRLGGRREHRPPSQQGGRVVFPEPIQVAPRILHRLDPGQCSQAQARASAAASRPSSTPRAATRDCLSRGSTSRKNSVKTPLRSRRISRRLPKDDKHHIDAGEGGLYDKKVRNQGSPTHRIIQNNMSTPECRAVAIGNQVRL